MKQMIPLAAALALFAAAPVIGQNNAEAPANVSDTNAANAAAPDANATAAPAPEAAPPAVEPAAPPETAAAPPEPARSNLPWGVLGLVGLIGLMGMRRR